jgi:hypothetical protein
MTQSNEIQDDSELEVNPVTNTVMPMFADEELAALETPTDAPKSVEDVEPVEPSTPDSTPVPPVEELYSVPVDAQLPVAETQPSTLSEADQQELATLRANRDEILRVQAINQNATQAQTLQNEITQKYVNLGYDQETAQRFAVDMAQERMAGNARAQEAQEQNRVQQEYNGRKQRAISAYSTKYGVDPAALAGFNDAPSMEAYALLLKNNGETSRRLAKLEGNLVDDGAPDGGLPSGSAPMSTAQLLAATGANPDMVISPEQKTLLDAYVKTLT